MTIEPLSPAHAVDTFDCGNADLNRFLSRFATTNVRTGSGQTHVAVDGDRVVGFYTLTVGGIERANAPERVAKGMPRYPIPVIILARLGVDLTGQGRGVGRGLLKDVLLRADRVAQEVGIRALLVHAKDDAAKAWYRRHAAFDPSPFDPYQLFLLMKDLRRALG